MTPLGAHTRYQSKRYVVSSVIKERLFFLLPVHLKSIILSIGLGLT